MLDMMVTKHTGDGSGSDESASGRRRPPQGGGDGGVQRMCQVLGVSEETTVPEQASSVAGSETRKEMGSQILRSPWPF